MGVLVGRRSSAPRVARAARVDGLLASLGIASRSVSRQGEPATPESALRFSAVWAALRLRSDLISTLPVDVFRHVPGGQVEAPASRLFRRPAEGMLWPEWVYSTQMDLDRYGNAFGLIEATESGYPVQIEPWAAGEVTVRFEGRRIVRYVYDRQEFDPSQVWHERQYTVAGMRVGLSPIAYAAWTVGAALSAQEFSLDWFANGASPSGTLRHTEEANLDPRVLEAAKARFKVATANRDLFVTGKEWEFTPQAIDANSAQFLQAQGHSAVDVARFIGVPATAIDAAVSGQALTYANLTMQQLHLLVNFLTAPIVRREWALTFNALPQPRFVKFNTDALLRLDPTGRVELLSKQIDAWLMDPDEGRALNNLPPLTPEQIEMLKQRRKSASAKAEDGAQDDDSK